MTNNYRQRIAQLTRERDEARAMYLALRDEVRKLYDDGSGESHSEDDWWWCDELCGVDGTSGILGRHSDKREWRNGGAT